MNENVIDVLIYIYENYMDAEESVPTDQILLEEELVQAGFPQGEIKKAFNWLDELAWRQGSLAYADAQPNRSMRVFSEKEAQRIDLEIQGMLLYLEQTGILDPMSSPGDRGVLPMPTRSPTVRCGSTASASVSGSTWRSRGCCSTSNRPASSTR